MEKLFFSFFVIVVLIDLDLLKFDLLENTVFLKVSSKSFLISFSLRFLPMTQPWCQAFEETNQ